MQFGKKFFFFSISWLITLFVIIAVATSSSFAQTTLKPTVNQNTAIAVNNTKLQDISKKLSFKQKLQLPIKQQDLDLAKRTEQLIEKFEANPTSLFSQDELNKFNNLTVPNSIKDKAIAIAQTTKNQVLTQQQQPISPEYLNNMHELANYKILVFVSLAMGETALRQTFALNAGKAEVAIIFRGIPENMKLSDAINHIQRMVGLIDEKNMNSGFFSVEKQRKINSLTPNIIIDPFLFRQHNITQVPSVVAQEVIENQQDLNPDSRFKFISTAKVVGLSDSSWLLNKIKNNNSTKAKYKNFGQKGPTVAISEPDLVELMQKKILAIDWEKKQKQTLANFWQQQQFVNLSTAPKNKVKTINPAFALAQDMLDAQGRVLFKTGTIFNPFDLREFTLAYLIFNPLSKDELKLVKKLLPVMIKHYGKQQILTIATQIDREAGWDNFAAISKDLDIQLFILQPEMQQRYAIEHTPSIVTGDNKNKVFVVHEFHDDSYINKWGKKQN